MVDLEVGETVAMASPFVVALAAADRRILEATARSGRAEHPTTHA
jgi:hypothetical protein